MAASSRYRALGRRLALLKKHHLAFKPRLAGNYTVRQLSQAAAYTVFAHGEFEDFIEDWAMEILNRIHSKGHGSGASPMLAHLFAHRKENPLPTRLPLPAGSPNWQTLFGQVIGTHRGIIDNSHGIKAVHICKMLIPLGVDLTVIDQFTMSELDSFASIRGNHAHKSMRAHLGQQFDPFDRAAKVNNIYGLLLPLDECLQAHLAVC
jgi:hypothetical protein